MSRRQVPALPNRRRTDPRVAGRDRLGYPQHGPASDAERIGWAMGVPAWVLRPVRRRTLRKLAARRRTLLQLAALRAYRTRGAGRLRRKGGAPTAH